MVHKMSKSTSTLRIKIIKLSFNKSFFFRWFQNFDWDGLANLTMVPPILQPVTGPLDTSNFDVFPLETDIPVDELSGWDSVNLSYNIRLDYTLF